MGIPGCTRPLAVPIDRTLPGRSGSWINTYLNRPSYRLMAAAVGLEPEDELLDIAGG